jgi:hypothetical protein
MSDAAALRPLGVGDILDESFRIYRENFGYLVMLGVVTFGPVAVIVALLTGLGVLLGETAGIVIAATLGGVLAGLGGLVMFAAMVYAVAGVRRGRRPTIGEAIGQSIGRLLPLIGLTLIVTVAIMVLMITIVGWIWVGVLWSMSYSVLLLEGGGITNALGRSRQLVRGTWWRVFGILVLIWIISFFISFVIAAVGGMISGLLLVAGTSTPVEVARQVIQTIFNVAAQALTQPFVVAGMVLLYYDLRVRKEGLDLQERAESLLASGAPASPA